MKAKVGQILRGAGLCFHLIANTGGRVPVVVAEHNMLRASAMHAREDIVNAILALEDAGFEAIDFGMTIYVRGR